MCNGGSGYRYHTLFSEKIAKNIFLKCIWTYHICLWSPISEYLRDIGASVIKQHDIRFFKILHNILRTSSFCWPCFHLTSVKRVNLLVEYSYFISLTDNLRPPTQPSPAQPLSRVQVASSIFLHRGVFGGGEGGGWHPGPLLQLLLFDEHGLGYQY